MNLYIGNLNQDTTADTLRRVFSEFGEVLSTKVIMDNTTGMSRGFGFVEMAEKGHGIDAMDNLDATYLEGNIISVKEAKQNNGPGGNSGGNRFNSGGNRFNSGGDRFNPNRPARPKIPRPRQGDYNSDRYNSY